MVDLRAEAAADIGGNDAQLVLRDVQHEGAHQQPDHVRVLAGGVEREIARGGIELAHRRARLHRIRDQSIIEQIEPDHFRGGGEGRIDQRLVAEMPVIALVIGHIVMHPRRAGRDGVAHVGDGGQIGQVQDQKLRRVLRLLAGLGDHHRDRVADMAHLADRQHRMRRLGHRAAVLVVDLPAAGQAADLLGRQIGAGEHRHHTGGRRSRAGVDPVDARVRPVGALDVGIELARAVDVVGIMTAPAQEPNILLAADRGTDAFESHGTVSPRCDPAARAGAGRIVNKPVRLRAGRRLCRRFWPRTLVRRFTRPLPWHASAAAPPRSP